jgi:hypothetical protein
MEALGGKTQDRSFEMAIEGFDKGGKFKMITLVKVRETMSGFYFKGEV